MGNAAVGFHPPPARRRYHWRLLVTYMWPTSGNPALIASGNPWVAVSLVGGNRLRWNGLTAGPAARKNSGPRMERGAVESFVARTSNGAVR